MCLAGLLILGRVDIHPAAFLIEPHDAIDKGEQRVVFAHAHVAAGAEFGAALANDDVAGNDPLAAKTLHAKALSIRITTVAG